MTDIKLDIPDITVVISEGDQYVTNVQTQNEVTVLVQSGEQFLSSIHTANTITTNATNYLAVADVAISSSYAATASYVIFDKSGSLLPSGVVSSSTQIIDYNVFATTGSNIFVGNQVVSGSQTISGSLITNADTLILTGSMLISGTLEISETIIGTITQALTASFVDGGFY